MWIWYSIAAALVFGLMGRVSKNVVEKNNSLFIILFISAVSALFLLPALISPSFSETGLSLKEHLFLVLKSLLFVLLMICSSFAILHGSGLFGFNISMWPVIVLLLSVYIFDEQYNIWEWAGMALSIISFLLIGYKGRLREDSEDVRLKLHLSSSLLIIAAVASTIIDRYLVLWINPILVQGWTGLYSSAFAAMALFIQSRFLNNAPIRIRINIPMVLLAALYCLFIFLFLRAVNADNSKLPIIAVLLCAVIIAPSFIRKKYDGGSVFLSKYIKFALYIIGVAIILVSPFMPRPSDKYYRQLENALAEYVETDTIKERDGLVNAAEITLKKAKNHEHIAVAYYVRAVCNKLEGVDETDLLTDLRKACLQIAKTQNNYLIARFFLDYGTVLNDMLWYNSATYTCAISLHYYRLCDVSDEQIMALINLAEAKIRKLNPDHKDVEDALQYSLEAVELADNLNTDDTILFRALAMLSECQAAAGYVDDALATAKQAYLVGGKNKDFVLARAYYQKRDADSALLYALQDAEIDEPRPLTHRLIAEIYINLLDDPESAAVHLMKYGDSIKIEEVQDNNQRILYDQIELLESDIDYTNRRWSFLTVLGCLFLSVWGITIFSIYNTQSKFKLRLQKEESERVEQIADELRLKLVNADSLVSALRESPKYLTDSQWDNLVRVVDAIYDGYCADLVSKGFTNNNVRLAAAIKLGFSTAECSVLFGISPSSITRAKNRLKGKNFD